MSDTKTIAEIDTANASAFAFHTQFERDVYFALSERKHVIEDKLRFGLLALHAGSLVAIFSLISSGNAAARFLRLDSHHVAISSACLLGGIFLVGVSLRFQENLEGLSAARALGRMLAAQQVNSSMQKPYSAENFLAYGKQMTKYHDQPLVGFNYSLYGIVAYNVSAGLWVYSALSLVARALGWG